MRYKDWKYEVDMLCFRHYGVYTDDLPDWLWHDAYQDGLSPREAFFDFKENMAERSFSNV